MINLNKLFPTAVSIAALAAVGVVFPMGVSAQSPSTQSTYTTALTQVQPVSAPGEFDGRLKLTVSADGIVNGFYFPADEGTIVAVVGGEQNGKYWMDIGGNTRLHIYAQAGKDGSLIGTATPTPYALNMGHEDLAETYSFVAKLTTN
jgi:hypothetical protein